MKRSRLEATYKNDEHDTKGFGLIVPDMHRQEKSHPSCLAYFLRGGGNMPTCSRQMGLPVALPKLSLAAHLLTGVGHPKRLLLMVPGGAQIAGFWGAVSIRVLAYWASSTTP